MEIMTKKTFNIATEWAMKEAWDGSTGHDVHCRAIPQNIRGFEGRTGPCNCKVPGLPSKRGVIVVDNT